MARFLATAKDIVVFNRIRELAFAHYAWTADGSGLGTKEEGFEEGQVKEAGSGILAAPRFGISAKHVSKGFEKLSPQLDAIRRRSSPLDPQYRINKIKVDLATMVYQVPDGDGLKHWKVDVDWQSHDTDITTLQMTPMSPAAEKADAGSLPFFEWQLRSPKVGSIVRLYGWPNQKLTIDRETADHRAIVELRVEPARVIQICDPLQFHGLTEFPGFVLDREFPHGFSGGPVLYGDALVGVFTGPDYVSSLWPLAIHTFPDVNELEHSFEELFDSSTIVARDWDEVKGRVERVPCEEALAGTKIDTRCPKNHVVLKN